MKRQIWVSVIAAIGLCVGCIQARRGVRFEMRLDGPAFPSGFQCVGLVVTGEGIPAQDNPQGVANWEAIYRGGVCPYAGVSSAAKAISSADKSVDLELLVPSGRNRTVQVVGVQTASGSCPSQKISDLLIANSRKELSSDVLGIYELGRQYLDTYHASAITVKPNYNASSAKNLLTCDSTTGGGGGGEVNELFSYSSVRINLNDKYFLRPTGGTAPYTFTRRQGDATLLPQTDYALLVGASSEDTSIVDVTDGTGKTATLTVTTASLNIIGTLAYQYSADRYHATPDNGLIDGTNTWANRGTNSTYVLTPPVFGVSQIRFHQSGGPRGNPSVTIAQSDSFTGSSVPSILTGPHSILAVVRRASTSTGVSVVCFSSAICSSSAYQSWLTLGMTGAISYVYVYDTANTSNVPATGTANTGWYLLVSHFQPSPNQLADLTVAGTRYGPIGHDIASFVFPSNASLRIGGIGAGGSEGAWEIAEVLVIEGSVDTAAPESALRAKYGLP